MKTRIIALNAVLILVILTNCKKTEETIAPSLSVNPTSKDIESTAGNFNIAVTATVAWTASCDKNWILLDPMNGTGNATVKADFQDNTSAASRTASIVFKGVGVEDRVVSVTQLGIQPILTVSPANLSVAADAGNAVINIISNLSWTVTSNQTWCIPAQSSGIGNADLTLNYQPNTVQSQRTAIITFAANGVTNQTVQVTQAAFVPNLIVTPSNITVNSPAGTATFNINSNVTWAATTEQTWCTLSPASGSNSASLLVSYQENQTTGPRVATITLTGADVQAISVTLTQNNIIPTLSVAPANRKVSSHAGNTTFQITSNTSWSAVSNELWCSIENGSGTGDGTLNVAYEENTTINPRTATISVTVAGLPTQTVTVTQSSVIPENGLVAWYPFNGNANDVSGNNNNCIVYGATITTDRNGNSNSAYSFNGQSNYIKGSSNNLPIGERTISIWLFANSISTNPTALAYGGSYCGDSWFQIISTSLQSWRTDVHCGENPFSYPYTSSPTGQWYHWVITNDLQGRKMYINGTLVATNSSFVNNTYVINKDFVIGSCVSGDGYGPMTNGDVGWFDGKLDDIRIYNRALSEQEIQQLYNE